MYLDDSAFCTVDLLDLSIAYLKIIMEFLIINLK